MVTTYGASVVAKRLGVSTHLIEVWQSRYTGERATPKPDVKIKYADGRVGVGWKESRMKDWDNWYARHTATLGCEVISHGTEARQ